MKSFAEECIEEVLKKEGGYSNNQADSGGETNYGITNSVARSCGYHGDMKDLPKERAIAIYRALYWSPIKADIIAHESEVIAIELFDTAVNCGVGFASKSFQRALNALNNQETAYPDMKVDGIIGPTTIKAYKSFLHVRGNQGEIVLDRLLNCIQGAHYLELSERRQKDEAFIFGWMLHRVTL